MCDGVGGGEGETSAARRRRIGWFVAAVVVIVGSSSAVSCAVGQQPATAQGPPEQARSGGAGGAYTADQALQGDRIFNQGEGCVRCHSVQEFAGRGFEIRWADRTVADLQFFILSQMPLDSPGILAPQAAWALTAYILQINGHPPGEQLLGSDLERAQAMPLAAYSP